LAWQNHLSGSGEALASPVRVEGKEPVGVLAARGGAALRRQRALGWGAGSSRCSGGPGCLRAAAGPAAALAAAAAAAARAPRVTLPAMLALRARPAAAAAAGGGGESRDGATRIDRVCGCASLWTRRTTRS